MTELSRRKFLFGTVALTASATLVSVPSFAIAATESTPTALTGMTFPHITSTGMGNGNFLTFMLKSNNDQSDKNTDVNYDSFTVEKYVVNDENTFSEKEFINLLEENVEVIVHEPRTYVDQTKGLVYDLLYARNLVEKKTHRGRAQHAVRVHDGIYLYYLGTNQYDTPVQITELNGKKRYILNKNFENYFIKVECDHSIITDENIRQYVQISHIISLDEDNNPISNYVFDDETHRAMKVSSDQLSDDIQNKRAFGTKYTVSGDLIKTDVSNYIYNNGDIMRLYAKG